MTQLTVYQSNRKSTHAVEKGTSLLRALQLHGFEVYSPCGGNGTCGKCKVYVKGEGFVSSCLFVIDRKLEIVLPDPVESTILTSQYKNTIVLPFDPGPTVALSAYPMGVAVDIGTTTLVFYLVNLITGSLIETRSTMNPQSKYGADVISRINYCIQNKDGQQRMQTEIIQVMNVQFEHFALALGIDTNDIVKVSVTGNTTMLHLFWGENPSSLAFVPFKPVFVDEKTGSGRQLGFNCHPEAEIKSLPSVAAYIGADLVAGITSLAPDDKIKNYLFVDVGTNGEMALITEESVYCCATAAGPAFEGANISHGMPAVEGAISAFNSEGINTIANAQPAGICGSGLIDVAAYLVNSRQIEKDGTMEEDFRVAENISSDKPIMLTQQDVRELQLAKSAIASGLKIMLKHSGKTWNDIDALYLAGGFGNYIRVESAIAIGLLPIELSGKIVPVGNASGTGAMLDLKTTGFAERTRQFIQKAKCIELSEDEDFVMEFAMNMEFPSPEDESSCLNNHR